MPSRKRDERETRTTVSRAPKHAPSDTRDKATPRIPPAYQEGRVDSVGERPSGTDDEDRTGEAGTRPGVPRTPAGDAKRDAFTSGEVTEKSDGDPGRPERTRG